ncbi:hypothetical protein ABFX02_11G038800 [Erythranthe guttata]
MVYTYTPTNYTSLQDSITSICRNVLPFSFKKRRRPLPISDSDQYLSNKQSDNLKWQQDSFHKILNLTGLCKEGIVVENEVSAFRIHLLETLIASPLDQEPTPILRDKLIFLKELLYAKCISEEEYHASKRPLLQRLAVQGAEIDARDVILGAQKETSTEEWSVIDLKDDKSSIDREILASKNNKKGSSTIKKMKGAVSAFGFASPLKNGKLKETNVNNEGDEILRKKDRKVDTSIKRSELEYSTENPFWNGGLNDDKENGSKSILMVESLDEKQSLGSDKTKRKPFRTIFQREQEKRGSFGNDNVTVLDEREKGKIGKIVSIFDGFKKWTKIDSEYERDELSINEKRDEASYHYEGKLVSNPIGEGPDTKQIKRKLHPNGAPTDFFVDKVLGERIKEELSRIQTELGAKSPNVYLTDDEIETISTRIPVDKADLNKYFPKSWCDEYGDIVLDVVRKEFEYHMRETGNSRSRAGKQKHKTFDYENSDPNLHCKNREQAAFSSLKNCQNSSKI